MLQSHIEGKIRAGGDDELTRHDKLVVLQRFLATNQRSPRVRAAIAQALNLNSSQPAAHTELSSEGTPAPAIAGSASASWPLPGSPDAPISERQRRDRAEAAAQPGTRQQRGSTRGVEILTGKKLRKAAAREVREASAYEREEDDQPLAPSFRDRMKQHEGLQGPAVLSAEYLEDAVSRGRFVWPPRQAGPAPNATDDCERCHRLKLVSATVCVFGF